MWAAGFMLGNVVGGPLAGWFSESLSWRWLFWLNLPILAVGLGITLFAVEESRDDSASRSIDWFGVVTPAVALLCLLFGLQSANELGWASPAVAGSLVASALLLTLFLVYRAPATGAVDRLRPLSQPHLLVRHHRRFHRQLRFRPHLVFHASLSGGGPGLYARSCRRRAPGLLGALLPRLGGDRTDLRPVRRSSRPCWPAWCCSPPDDRLRLRQPVHRRDAGRGRGGGRGDRNGRGIQRLEHLGRERHRRGKGGGGVGSPGPDPAARPDARRDRWAWSSSIRSPSSGSRSSYPETSSRRPRSTTSMACSPAPRPLDKRWPRIPRPWPDTPAVVVTQTFVAGLRSSMIFTAAVCLCGVAAAMATRRTRALVPMEQSSSMTQEEILT